MLLKLLNLERGLVAAAAHGMHTTRSCHNITSSRGSAGVRAAAHLPSDLLIDRCYSLQLIRKSQAQGFPTADRTSCCIGGCVHIVFYPLGVHSTPGV